MAYFTSLRPSVLTLVALFCWGFGGGSDSTLDWMRWRCCCHLDPGTYSGGVGRAGRRRVAWAKGRAGRRPMAFRQLYRKAKRGQSHQQGGHLAGWRAAGVGEGRPRIQYGRQCMTRPAANTHRSFQAGSFGGVAIKTPPATARQRSDAFGRPPRTEPSLREAAQTTPSRAGSEAAGT